ncbi:FecR domain-containing protein [Bradyrhizobium sp. CB82]|uniref:FecR domain-containing protein n=1 Tax=Bradyrhizobium sp. CB82 TaxID=3039159 RepID=UPI0024B0F370|nr:FecR domain-containing protein [Bradyrhizobium sp. CB82]WFU40503.1 FecR domain-containing protein [Bradyrhizobium sp. CB82]
MKYAGNFDAALSLHGQGFHAPASGHVDAFSVSGHGQVPQGAYFVPDPNLLFHGEFKRTGVDLLLSNDGHEFVIHDYFKGEKRAAIASPDGAHLTGDIVNALAGNIQYAQAASGAATAQVIGHITKLTGSATAVRNGVSIILNNGDNVEKGDVLSTGSDSTLGVTFIDGTVFGLSSNARMVLNEMVYDPNGSSNSSLLSLVAGTITFVAGETAKHGDMKIDTPVATMGIRGTAVLTEISFSIPSGGGDPQPQANFQVLVEPDGTTGSYILFDKVTLLPIATVNQAGQMIQISGGNVSVTNALLSPDVQKLITDVFSLKFTDNNTNTKLTNNSTDSITQDANLVLIKTASGATAQATYVNTVSNGNNGQPTNTPDKPTSLSRVPGPPEARSLDSSGSVKTAFALTELGNKTGDTADLDVISGKITFFDFNVGDRPTVKVAFASFTYHDALNNDVTAGLSDLQKADIVATEARITVVPASANTNIGSAAWSYSVPDNAFDFLAAGETLTLTYRVRVDNNFAQDNQTAFIDITITVTGTNDLPVITSSVPTITFEGGTSVPGGPLTSEVPTAGTLTFTDVDLTDTHKVSVKLTGATLPDGGTVPPGPLAAFEKAMSVAIDTDSTGSGDGVIDWSLADLPVYLADFIPKGEVLTLTYTVTITDSQGATTTQTITVTIKGTDSPAVVWVATNAAGSPPGGFWKDAANWETGTVPTIDDDVIVITDQLHGLTPSYPVTIDEAAFAKSLTMNDFGGPPPEVINKSILTIAGALNLSADSILANSVGATISVGGKAEILDTSVLTNSGTLTLAGGGDFAVGASITNAGTIELTGGTLKTLAEVHDAGGTLKVDAGATLDIVGATIDSGKLIIGGTLVLEATSFLINGELDNSGVVTVMGTVAFDKETVDNDSIIEIKAGAKLTLDQWTTIANSSGTITVDDHGVLVLNQAEITGGKLNVSGTLSSNGTSTITNSFITNDNLIEAIGGLLALVATTPATITNAGTLQANGGELDVNGEAVTNTGTLAAINDGMLKLVSTTVTNTGATVSVDAGSRLDFVGATIDGGTLMLSGTLVSTGISAIDDADITNVGTIDVTGGTLTIDPLVQHTITNQHLITANGGELDVTGDLIVNTGMLEAINGGVLKLDTVKVTNTGGTVTVDGTSKLYLSGVEIDGGNLGNAGHLYSVTGSNTVTAGVTNTGTIEVQDGTLDLAGGLSGAGSLIIDNGATLELAGATAQTISFAGGTDTLQLDNVAGQSFTGTIAGQSTSGGTFTATGAGNITTASGDALDFTASGGTIDAPADIVLAPTGSLTGAANGIFVTQNGGGDISLGATRDITGLNGNGIWLRDSASGSGNITVTNLTGKATGTGAGSEGVLVENLNAANDGEITIKQLGGAAGGAYGIDATTHGDGDVSIEAGGNITGGAIYGIRARSYGTGSETVTTDAGSIVTSGSSGIVAVNRATSIDASEGSTITVNAYGTISSGSSLNQSGSAPAGIQVGYNGNPTGSLANTDVNGTVIVNNYANITAAAGFGIEAHNWGNGDVTVNDGAGTTVIAGDVGIRAQTLSGGAGDITVALGADASVTGTSSYGILAYSVDQGDIAVTMSNGDSIASGSSGIVAVNYATAIAGGVDSTIFVTAHGTIHSGSSLNNDETTPGGIIAGYKPEGTKEFSSAVNGDVTVESDATITADAGFGIEAFTWGVGDITVTTGETSSITAAGTAIGAFDHGGGDVSVTNEGSATGAVGLSALATGAGDITIVNDGDLTGTGAVGIVVKQDSTGATGSTLITNKGTVVGADGHAAIFVQQNATGAALIDNSGTIGPDNSSAVTSTTYAIVETGGHVTINNTGDINGNISVASTTFNNEAGGTWTVSGSSFFGTLSTFGNAGEIDLHDGASISGADGSAFVITNSGQIESWGSTSITGAIVNTGSIEIDSGTLTVFGSLSGSGSVTIDANATLDVKATVWQTLTFSGAGAELQIDTASFGGSVAGFAATDKLDLSTITFDGGTTASYDAETGNLVVSDAYGHSITVKLVGDYSNAHFAGSDDGTGHTLITLNAADDSNVNVWTGNVDQTWTVDGNWTLDRIPTATETAYVDSVQVVNLNLGDSGYTIGGLSLTYVTEVDITGTGYNPDEESVDSFFAVNGKLYNAGAIYVDKAIFLASQDVTNKGIIEADDPHAVLVLGGPSGGMIDNLGGQINAANGATIDLFNEIVNGGQINASDEGSIVVLNNATLNGTELNGDGQAMVEVIGDSTLDGTDSQVQVHQLGIGVHGTLVFDGNVTDDGSIDNQGTIIVETGATTITGDLTGLGAVQIMAASLELGGISDSAIQFVGSGVGTLHLDSTSHFTCTVTGFSYGDTIHLADIDTENVSFTNYDGALQVHYGSGDGDYFTITGGYDEAGFTKVDDGHGGTDLVWSHQSPVIDTTHFTHVHDEATNIDTVTGLSVSGSPTETYTVTAETEGAQEGTGVTPSSLDGVSLDQVNTALHSVTYDPGATPPDTDMIIFKVTDSLGASDTVNFIFDEGGSAPVTLTGTSSKDVIFATQSSDTLISGRGQDQFVFGPASTTDAVQHTAYGFDTTQDKIDLRQFDTINSVADLTITQQNADTLITLDDHETILLKNVVAGNLHAGDFIVTNHGTT